MSKPKSGEGDCLCLCGLNLNSTSSTSYKNTFCKDHLHNWETWMKRRSRVHERLSKIGRDPGNLLMNINEEVRNVTEDRLMLDYLKIETDFDKYRGNPAFFKLPDALSNKNKPPFTIEPTYFRVMSKVEKNQIPDIEYVTVPEDILKEKGVLPRDRDLYKSWKAKNTYRYNKITTNKDKLKKVEKHKPDLNNLIIIGKRIESLNKDNNEEKQEKLKLSADKVSCDNKLQTDEKNIESKTKISDDINNDTFFKINHIEFYQNSPSFSYCKSINIFFKRSSDEIVPTEKTLLIENVGLTTLRLYWKRYKKIKLFRDFTNLCPILNNFCFNKNELLLLPNEKKEFPIWFTSKEPGGYCENWEITTLPNVANNGNRIIVSLKGFVFVKNFETFAVNVNEMLDKKVTDAIVKDILEEVVRRGNYCAESELIVNDFSEKQLFESQNLKKEISILAPKYVYNPKVIKELRLFYKEVKRQEDCDEWDLSIKHLEELAREKDITIFAKEKSLQLAKNIFERENMVDKSLNINDKKLKTVEKDEKTISAKSSDKKNVKGIVTISHAEEPAKITFHRKLKNILQNLLRPAIFTYVERKKYLFGYLVIKTYLNKAFHEIEYLEGKCTEFLSKNKYGHEVPQRLIFETFNESYIERTKRITPEEAIAFKILPKTTLLKDIPLDDAKRIYKIYFGKEIVNDKGKKKVKGETDNNKTMQSRKTKPSKDNKLIKEKVSLHNVMVETKEDFHPFSEEFVEPTNLLEQKIALKFEDAKDFCDKTEETLNYEQKYLIVYTHLCEAVDALVDTIEICKSVEASPNVLKEMQNCNALTSSFTIENEVEEVLVQEESISKSENVSKASFKKGVDKARSATGNVQTTEVSNQIKVPNVVINEEYFEFLMDSHLKSNILSQKYIVNEEKLDVKTIQEPNINQDVNVKTALSNVFSLSNFKRDSIPFGYNEAQVQTSFSKVELMTDLAKYLEITQPSLLRKDVKCDDGPSDENLDAKKSSDIFYFLNNSEQDED